MNSFPAPEPRRRLSTGIFSLDKCRPAVMPEELARAAQELVGLGTAAVLVLPTCSSPAQSAVATAAQVDVGMTSPLLDWLGTARQPGVIAVPHHLRRLMRCFRAVLVPVASPVMQLGSLVVPAPVDSPELARDLEGLAIDYALRLDVNQRRQILERLADCDGTSEEPSSGTRPKVTITPSSRRIA